MRKVYKIDGKTEVHEVFTSPSGKTKYKVTFSKGNLDPKNRVPARYTTDSPIIQAVIESSPKFGRVIFLEKTYNDDAPAASAPAVKPAAPVKKGKAKAEEAKAKKLLQALYAYFIEHPDRLPDEFVPFLEKETVARVVCDYLSGMTDRYAITVFENIFIPTTFSMSGLEQ